MIVTSRMPSPWSKAQASDELPSSDGAMLIRQDDIDDDDDITLLPTKKSIAEYSSSLACSSPLHHYNTSSPSPHQTNSPVSKMVDLMDAIAEAENELACIDSGNGQDGLSIRVRSYFTLEAGAAILRNEVVATLVKRVQAIPSSSTKTAVATHSTSSSEEGPKSWCEVDVQDLSKLLKVMHRGIDRAAGLDPFPRRARHSRQASAKKKSQSGIISTSSSPAKLSREEDGEERPLTEAAVGQMQDDLCRIASATKVTDVCLVLLSKEGTNKALLCEEMVLPCLQLIKTALDYVLVPFAEACNSKTKYPNPPLDGLVNALASRPGHGSMVAACAEHLETIFRCIQSSLPRIEKLLKRPDTIVSETMAFLLASMLLPCFFIPDPEPASLSSQQASKTVVLGLLGGGFSPMKSLRMSAIHVLRLTYERSEEQKEYMIMTILDSMQSLQDTRKPARRHFGQGNGKSVCSATALLLQIIQSSVYPIAVARKTSETVWDENENEGTDSGEIDGGDKAAASDVFSLRQLLEGQDVAQQAAKTVAQYLIAKLQSGAAKTTKTGSNAIEAASAVEAFVADLLDTLLCPEWPASALLLGQLCTRLYAYLDDDKGSHDVRGVALEQLGLIAAQVSESKQRGDIVNRLASLSAIRKAADVHGLDQLHAAYLRVVSSLRQRAEEGDGMESAARFLEAQWGREMAVALEQTADMIEAMSDGGHEEDVVAATTFIRHLDNLIGRFVQGHVDGSSDESALSSVATYEFTMHTFDFCSQFDAIQGQLLLASNGPNAVNRNKALRGLSYISEVDGSFLQREEVRAAVQRCMYDESVHVRDTAVGLLGKLALCHGQYLDNLLPMFKEKMQDTGLLVRKRTMRLLKDIHDSCSDNLMQVEAALEIVQCVFDEEESLRDLAVDSTAQMWFEMMPSGARSPSRQQTKAACRNEQDEQDEQDDEGWKGAERGRAQKRLCNIVQVADRLRVKPSPVEEVLRLIVKRRQGGELQSQMGQLIHLTLDNIFDLPQGACQADELVKQVKVISLLVQTNPQTLSIRKAKALLPYLRGGATQAEISLLGQLLSIFNACLPIMPSTAASFAKQLQAVLTPLVSKPSNLITVLEDLIKCLCTVVRCHTHDYVILVRSMHACHHKLQKVKEIVEQGGDARTAKVLMMTTALLTENADYDSIRMAFPEYAGEINNITPASVHDQVAGMMTSLLSVTGLRSCALHSLGFICRSFPNLLMSEAVDRIIEEILKHGTQQDQSVVLQIISDVVGKEPTKMDPANASKGKDMARPAKVDRQELAGESEGQGSAVTSEIVSQYMDLVLPLAVWPTLQKRTLEIVEIIVLRGICHPMACLPTIIALQTVIDERSVSSKAQSLHRHLISKYNTCINFRHPLHARAAWDFQAKRGGVQVRGFCPEDGHALFSTWYSTICDQKRTRLDFVKGLVKAFGVDTSTGQCSEADVHYARFVAENLATLHFKTVEEVLVVLLDLQNVVATTGEQVRISVQEEVPVDGEEDENDEDMDKEDQERAIVIGRLSTIVSIALLLRQHIQQLYALSDGRVARGADRKASNAPAVRKLAASVLALDSLPGVWNRSEGIGLAKREMAVFDNLLSSEGTGGDADDYEMDA